ncbi:Glycosyl transferases group 1 [Bacteroidales bacterium Barb6]|nr:Glycosyl transferases group 1 [Bacteroidales bacterium Barb6]
MGKYFFIYDVGPKSRLEWLASAFSGKEVAWLVMKYNHKNRIYKWRRPLHFLGYMELACRAVLQSKSEDYIISWNFIIGAFVCAICRLFGLKRTILSLNMISHPKGGINALIRKKTYDYVFSYRDFFLTVNSKETLSAYLKEYNLDSRKVTVLPDALLPEYKEKEFNFTDSYIFCGGEAQRDWLTFFQAARLLPEYQFVGVARKQFMPKEAVVPDNVKMYYDIDVERFDDLLAQASVVVLPLLSKMPAGLIVIFKSVLFSKPLIVTRTSSVENYLKNEENAFLIDLGDAQSLADHIIRLKESPILAESLTRNAKKSIEKYSPQAYSQTVYQICSA